MHSKRPPTVSGDHSRVARYRKPHFGQESRSVLTPGMGRTIRSGRPEMKGRQLEAALIRGFGTVLPCAVSFALGAKGFIFALWTHG
jgi:hypothetical protein